jgi:hypothetical protein
MQVSCASTAANLPRDNRLTFSGLNLTRRILNSSPRPPGIIEGKSFSNYAKREELTLICNPPPPYRISTTRTQAPITLT